MQWAGEGSPEGDSCLETFADSSYYDSKEGRPQPRGQLLACGCRPTQLPAFWPLCSLTWSFVLSLLSSLWTPTVWPSPAWQFCIYCLIQPSQ